MLKKNGKSKPMKKIKCPCCEQRVDISSEDIVEVSGAKYVTCPICFEDIQLKK